VDKNGTVYAGKQTEDNDTDLALVTKGYLAESLNHNSILPYITYEIENDEVTITGCIDKSISGSYVIPKTIDNYPVTRIDYDDVFSGCTNLTNIVLPEGIKDLGEDAFSYSGLTSITFPGSLSSIGSKTVDGCTSLQEATLLEGITSIDGFEGCSNLTKIYIPDTVIRIYSYAFAGCSSLNDIYYGGTQSQWEDIEIDEKVSEQLADVNIHYNQEPSIIRHCNDFVRGIINTQSKLNSLTKTDAGMWHVQFDCKLDSNTYKRGMLIHMPHYKQSSYYDCFTQFFFPEDNSNEYWTRTRAYNGNTSAWKKVANTVDQTYLPESQNAQSGIAVAEAIIPVINQVNQLDNVLKDILTAIQTDKSALEKVEAIEQTIVNYLETKTVAEVE
jgi:hypothetical protein